MRLRHAGFTIEALKDKSLGGEALSGPRDQALTRVKGSALEGSESALEGSESALEGSEVGSKEYRNAGMQEYRNIGIKD